METIGKIIEKLSSYQILNYLIPGGILCFLLKYLVGYDIIHFSVAENILICYFMGMVNSRLSSLILEWFLIKVSFVKYAPHEEYAKAEKKDAKISILTEENNMYRALANAMLLLLLAYGVKHIHAIELFMAENFNWITIVALFILYLCSFRKQTKYIKKRVDENKVEH